MRRRVTSTTDQHQDWLAQVETEGPFLSLPVLKDIWPHGVDRLGDADNRAVTFKQAFATWERAYDTQSTETKVRYAEVAHAWIETVLDDLTGWRLHRVGPDELPADLEIRSPGEQVVVRAHGAIRAREAGQLAALLRIADATESLHAPGLDGWAATEVDRMAALLRKAEVPIGIVTDGRWWAVVWAGDGKPTGSGVVDALIWREEPLLRDAFLTLIDQRRLRDKNPELRLPRLFERSELEAEEITEALGTQVRKSVELLVQAFSEARVIALKRGDVDPLTKNSDDVYQAAVTVMMRVVFLLFAEERGMLPTEQLYWDSYAMRELLDNLQERARHEGEENLDESHDVWHRLLALSEALFAGVNYDEMRMPAYGGSLLDPIRFPWLTATDEQGLRLKVSDRVMLHVLESVQVANVKSEARRISFRDVDVEQIGYIYEGLLGYTCHTVKEDVVLGLVGKDGEEPEIDATTLDELYQSTDDGKSFAEDLLAWVKEHQPAAKTKTAAQLAKLYDAPVDEAEMHRLLTPIAGDDRQLLDFLVAWGNFIRRDLRDIPHVVPIGGLVVVETPSRKNAGAHYTPRALAEEVVLHALQPLVFAPGPLQTNDENAWKLKSSTAILDLKVADIAAGSGAFLVAAARFLAARVVEAWIEERIVDPAKVLDRAELENLAIREVVARCLYGADINPMAVEMCKLSLWLVSLDPTKPFSFVDDKVFCGNSLLGVTTLDQLKHVHIAPDTKRKYLQPYVDVDAVLKEGTRFRNALASPVDEDDPQRSTTGKLRLLEQSAVVTAQLRLMADGIIAAGLPHGGKPGPKLEDAYKALEWALSEAFPADGSAGDRTKLEAILKEGLTPTVETDYDRWQPLHWVVEAPDVVVERGGFDAVIGNPPFLGVTGQSSALGENHRAWCIYQHANGSRGPADLVAYFLLAAVRLTCASAQIGIVATNSIAQNQTKRVGLDQVLDMGFEIHWAVKSEPWPAKSANLEYAIVCLSGQEIADKAARFVDREEAVRVSSMLENVANREIPPVRLLANRGISFEGSKIYGDGFLISASDFDRFISEDSRNKEVIFPYLGGKDLNSRPDVSASRLAIDFFDLTLEDAGGYRAPFRHVELNVRPERQKKNRQAYRDYWWHYGEKRPAMRRAIQGLRFVVAIARVSKTVMPVRVPTGQVISDACVAFATESLADLALLSSAMHQMWAIKYGSGMRNDPRYTPSDVFETFPRPDDTDRLEAVGKMLDEERREIMLRRQLGLTALYNLVNDPDVQDDMDLRRMREIHVEVDEATMAAYGWDDLPLDHGFHTYRQMERFTVSPAARVEMLDRLLQENQRRARLEGKDVPEQEEGLF
jgi:hypothetical protein